MMAHVRPHPLHIPSQKSIILLESVESPKVSKGTERKRMIKNERDPKAYIFYLSKVCKILSSV